MARERLCQYGDCDSTNIRVTVNTGDQRPAFCCHDHAALWLIRNAPGGRYYARSGRYQLAKDVEALLLSERLTPLPPRELERIVKCE
jgi:hypothetical protein